MPGGEETERGKGEGGPIGLSARSVLVAVAVIVAASILLLVAVRYAFF